MFIQSVRMAFRSIATSKMRSFLTMLGIIIGVIAVVVLVSLVSGATSSITSDIENLGSNLLTVNIRTNRYQPLQINEVLKLKNEKSIKEISPTVSKNITIKYEDNTYDDGTVEGVYPDYAQMNSIDLGEGRFLRTPDIDNSSAICIIGSDVADNLFTSSDPLGQTISVSGRNFLIVGVMKEAGQTMRGNNDNKVIIPFTLAERMFAQDGVKTFYVSAVDKDHLTEAQNAVEDMLMKKYNNDDDAFVIFNQASIIDAIGSVTGTLSLLLGGIAGISLLVGGIGIMNIMLVSVTERTREIGIRKAIGAGRRSILLQFLVEALVISCLGGIIGLGFSWGILLLISKIASMTFAMSAGVILLAIGFSMFIGVIFGLYPANKASKLHPIDALRYE